MKLARLLITKTRNKSLNDCEKNYSLLKIMIHEEGSNTLAQINKQKSRSKNLKNLASHGMCQVNHTVKSNRETLGHETKQGERGIFQ